MAERDPIRKKQPDRNAPPRPLSELDDRFALPPTTGPVPPASTGPILPPSANTGMVPLPQSYAALNSAPLPPGYPQIPSLDSIPTIPQPMVPVPSPWATPAAPSPFPPSTMPDRAGPAVPSGFGALPPVPIPQPQPPGYPPQPTVAPIPRAIPGSPPNPQPVPKPATKSNEIARSADLRGQKRIVGQPTATQPGNAGSPGTARPSTGPGVTPVQPISSRPAVSNLQGAQAASFRVPDQHGHVKSLLLAEQEGSNGLEITKHASRHAPPWLISMVVHILIVLALALIPLAREFRPVLMLEASYVDSLGEQMLDDSITTTAVETVSTEPAFSKDVNPVENPLAAMPQLQILLDVPGSNINLNAPSIGMALTGREKGAKEGLLAVYGGTALTESAVGLALEWLRKNQQRDGSWSLVGPYSNGVIRENKTAATAMALLAFQGNGHTHLQGPHRDAVGKGLKALLKMQDSDGNFFREGMSGHRLYSQAMATIVVCELYGMTKDQEVKKAAERALAYAAKIQADDGRGGGGWRYEPGYDVDTSVTGWFVMAFQSGRMAGLEPYPETMQRVSRFLDNVEEVQLDVDGSIKDIGYYYRRDESREPPKLSMTAEALLCRQYLGWEKNHPKLQAGVRKLLKPANRIDWNQTNLYYWYYATQVMHHMGGNEWHEWNKVMREELPKAQEKEGKERGSWSPLGDAYGSPGGRMYSTCFCVFMLESYYRHLPVYQH